MLANPQYLWMHLTIYTMTWLADHLKALWMHWCEQCDMKIAYNLVNNMIKIMWYDSYLWMHWYELQQCDRLSLSRYTSPAPAQPPGIPQTCPVQHHFNHISIFELYFILNHIYALVIKRSNNKATFVESSILWYEIIFLVGCLNNRGVPIVQMFISWKVSARK